MESLGTAKPMPEIMAYQNGRLIERYAKDYSVPPETAQQCFTALKQFLYLCAVTPGYKVTSDRIDSMWHTFLLFTKNYDEFCSHYLGRFVNHEPFESPAPEAYLETRARALQLFGKIDEEFWPMDAKPSCSSGCQD
jgi:hypothetical protein